MGERGSLLSARRGFFAHLLELCRPRRAGLRQSTHGLPCWKPVGARSHTASRNGPGCHRGRPRFGSTNTDNQRGAKHGGDRSIVRRRFVNGVAGASCVRVRSRFGRGIGSGDVFAGLPDGFRLRCDVPATGSGSWRRFEPVLWAQVRAIVPMAIVDARSIASSGRGCPAAPGRSAVTARRKVEVVGSNPRSC